MFFLVSGGWAGGVFSSSLCGCPLGGIVVPKGGQTPERFTVVDQGLVVRVKLELVVTIEP
jgi:hypothetical protein